MSLNYHIQEMPSEMYGSEKKLFPKVETYTVFDNQKMVKRISMESGIQEGAVTAVLNALPAALKRILLEGHTCKIDRLGTFSVSLSYNADGDVAISRLNLKADPDFLSQLRAEADLVKVQTEVVRVSRSKGRLSQRYELLMQWLERHSGITLQEYANLVGVSTSTASRELKSLCEDRRYGIACKGTGAWKQWVKAKTE